MNPVKLKRSVIITRTTFIRHACHSNMKQADLLSNICIESSFFRKTFQTLRDTASEQNVDVPESLLSKLATVLVFEFEARAKQSCWAELKSLIASADANRLSSLPLHCMADIILTNEAPRDTCFEVIEALTNIALGQPDHEVPRLARWLRLLFTISLTRDTATLDNFIAKLLQIVRDHTQSYPVDELQWLAARSFNEAVDLHGAGKMDRCHRMCELALNLGKYAQDEDLRSQIQKNYQQILSSL